MAWESDLKELKWLISSIENAIERGDTEKAENELGSLAWEIDRLEEYISKTSQSPVFQIEKLAPKVEALLAAFNELARQNGVQPASGARDEQLLALSAKVRKISQQVIGVKAGAEPLGPAVGARMWVEYVPGQTITISKTKPSQSLGQRLTANELGRQLNGRRRKKYGSDREAAKDLGTSVSTLHRWEGGKIPSPKHAEVVGEKFQWSEYVWLARSLRPTRKTG